MIKNWKPWEQSTGPKTEEGKETSKMNAQKHGAYSLEVKKLKDFLKNKNISFEKAIFRIDKKA